MDKPYLNSPTFYRKLLDLYKIDLAMVKDGHRPQSIACELWTRDMTQEETLVFIETRIGMIVAKLMTKLGE